MNVVIILIVLFLMFASIFYRFISEVLVSVLVSVIHFCKSVKIVSNN